jgi:hypothetical protein
MIIIYESEADIKETEVSPKAGGWISFFPISKALLTTASAFKHDQHSFYFSVHHYIQLDNVTVLRQATLYSKVHFEIPSYIPIDL